ncbi:MAG: DNA repair protein RecN [Legionellales bacterium]|nr:DNA repair protein RecN [Legionellales bacterium]
MLTTLSIKNFIIIRNLTIDFDNGMTVITGETGAGKSIIIKALEVALGKRFEKQFILDKKGKSEISINFCINQSSPIYNWLAELDLPILNNEVVIRRIFSIDGKAKNYLNDTLISATLLKKLTQKIINIHGQHENQLILNNEFQRTILDKYADNQLILKNLQSEYKKWCDIKEEINTLINSKNSKEKIQLLEFQINEMESHSDVIQNLKSVEDQHNLLVKSIDIKQAVNRVIEFINNEDDGCISKIQKSICELKEIQNLQSTELRNSVTCLQDSEIQLSEALDNIHRLNESTNHDPKELFEIENKLQKIYDIAKKHNVYPHDLAEHFASLRLELTKLQNVEESLLKLQDNLSETENKYRKLAAKLSQLRQKSAKNLSQEITNQIIKLDICGPFEIKVNYQNQAAPNIHGLDEIKFFIKTNPDTPACPMEQIVSGGELSRISLALQAITGKHTNISTIIFDEVDVGISGSTAEIVGNLLKEISAHTQIICITHLAQVASLADQHLKVHKNVGSKNTTTKIDNLDQNARIKEIARIIGGIKITQKTLQHAKEMIYQ